MESDPRSPCPRCGHPLWEHREEKGHGFKCWERLSHENNDFCGCTHGAPPKATLMLYAIRNSTGEFFRAKGRSGYGKSWVPDLIDAKFYAKVSTARSRVTYFANNNPKKLPVPELIEFKVTEVRVIDETDRVKDAKRKRDIEEARRQKAVQEQLIEHAKYEIEQAQARLRKLQGD